MFERYDEDARRALFFARYAASELGGTAIETEHLLLGIIRKVKGPASRILARARLPVEDIRRELQRRAVFREKIATSVEIPFSAETRRALQYAAEEADRLLHRFVRPEHLLLGLLREEASVAATVLIENGLHLDAVREHLVALLTEAPGIDAPQDHAEMALPIEGHAWFRARSEELEAGSASVHFRNNAYWLAREGQDPEGPYCPTCWDIDHRLVRQLTGPQGRYCEYCTRYRPKR